MTEDSVVCDTGGGFTRTEWRVGVNDGWMTLFQIVQRGTIDSISTELEDEDDPHGAVGNYWVDRPAQVYYRRRTYIVAPIGTRLRKIVFTPVRSRDGIRYSQSDSELVLTGENRLASRSYLDEKAERKARQAAQSREALSTLVRNPDRARLPQPESEPVRYGEIRLVTRSYLDEKAEREGRQAEQSREPLPKSATLHHLGALLSRLGARPPANAIPVAERTGEVPLTNAIPVAAHVGEVSPTQAIRVAERLGERPPTEAVPVTEHLDEEPRMEAVPVAEAPSLVHASSRRKDPVREPQFPTGSTPESKPDSDLASVTGVVETRERG